MSKPPSDWISLSDAADLLAAANVHFTTGTIGRWARTGHLQSVKIGNKRFVRRSQVRGLLRPEHGHPDHMDGENLQLALLDPEAR
jgi:hypothetical protein